MLKMKSIIKLLLVCVFFSCGNEKNNQQPNLDNQIEEPYTYRVVSQNLFKNPKLNSWDTNSKPTNWDINENFETPENYVIDRDTLDLLLKGHERKKVFIKQTVNIDPNSFYVLSCKVGSNLKSSSYAGVLIRFNNNIIGKRIFDKTEEQIYKVVFNSLEGKNIECFFGFIEAGEGSIKIKDMSLKKIELNNKSFDSEIAKEFIGEQSSSFDTEKSFDKTVENIIKQTSDLLLARKRKDSLNINSGLLIDNLLNEDSFFKKFLQTPADEITKSYPTRLVYSVVEILEEFNIGVQRIELHKNSKRLHLLLNYYNPYSLQWVTIDPFYNAMLNTNGDLAKITKEQIKLMEYGGLSKNIDGLIKKYSGSNTEVKKEKIIGFPF